MRAAGSPRGRLVLLSFLMLFVELALIRWTGSNVVYLSYFSNFVLLGSFLGIGIGFLRAKAKVDLFPWAAPALALLVLFVSWSPVHIDRSGSDLVFFGTFKPSGFPIWVMLPAIFVAVAAVMGMIAEGVARQFAQFRALDAYRLDTLCSIAGIAASSLLAFADAPPVAWGLVVAAVFLLLWLPKAQGLRGRPLAIGAVSLLLLVAPLAAESAAAGYQWSPYRSEERRVGK